MTNLELKQKVFCQEKSYNVIDKIKSPNCRSIVYCFLVKALQAELKL
jgi:hypothetical protein